MTKDLINLYRSRKTVFTSKELAMLWNISDTDKLKLKLYYFVKKGYLIRLRRGVFAKDKKFDVRELAVAMYTPAYISFETVLREEGVIFQHYETIFVASYLNRKITFQNMVHSIHYRKLKKTILYNPEGIEEKPTYSIATGERAMLDLLYVEPHSYFDNLQNLNWDRCFSMVTLYHNKELTKRLDKLYTSHKD